MNLPNRLFHKYIGHWEHLIEIPITSQYIIGNDWHNANRRTDLNYWTCILCKQKWST